MTTTSDPGGYDYTFFSLPSFYGPTSINNAGQLVSIAAAGYVYNYRDETYTVLPSIHVQTFTYTAHAAGINDAGQIAGFYSDGYYSHAFVYANGSYTILDSLPRSVPYWKAEAINDTGQIVGIANDGSLGVIYSNGSYTTFNKPSGASSFAGITGINDAGQIVGEYYDNIGELHGFVYSGGSYTLITGPAGASSAAVGGINNAGQIVGGYTDATGSHGFVYHNGTYTYTTVYDQQDGSLPFASVGFAAINNLGEIVSGYAVGQGYLAEPIAAPSVRTIEATTDNGASDVDVGHTITITAYMNEVVNVTGTPTLQLNDNAVATYQSGSGSKALVFTYTVKNTDTSNDLQVTGLNLNGGTIKDNAGKALSGSVAQDLALRINLFDVVPVSSGGMTINLKFFRPDNPTAQFKQAVEAAASLLSAAIHDKITVNIVVDYSGTGDSFGRPDHGQGVAYSTVRDFLIARGAPGANSLPSGSTFDNQSSIYVWNAQLKLMGLLGANDTSTDDGSVTFPTDWPASQMVTIALHELTHAMGRFVGTGPDIFDFYDIHNNQNGGNYFSLDGGKTLLGQYGTNDSSDFLNAFPYSGDPASYFPAQN
jgi:probable HAF family extracellular repeat protein